MGRSKGKTLFQLLALESLVIGVGIMVYSLFPFATLILDQEQGAILYANRSNPLYLLVLGAVVYLIYWAITCHKQNKITSRANEVVQWMLGKRNFAETKSILLILALKFQFIPLMSSGLIVLGARVFQLVANPISSDLIGLEYFNNIIYPFTVHLCAFLTYIITTFAYIVENKKLGSQIKSIDQSWLGWAAVIICYSPMYLVVFQMIPMYAHEFVFFKNIEATACIRLFLIITIVFKVCAVLTLGTKSSNLTNRGVVVTGPYRLVRHPHYLAKLIVWWTCILPIMVTNQIVVVGMIFWTAIYIVRALTEERHLCLDPDYIAYKEKVKWRFIPLIY
jgi:protein-S-isoprenylcysteine O-methyltransferase Ste14